MICGTKLTFISLIPCSFDVSDVLLERRKVLVKFYYYSLRENCRFCTIRLPVLLISIHFLPVKVIPSVVTGTDFIRIFCGLPVHIMHPLEIRSTSVHGSLFRLRKMSNNQSPLRPRR